MFSSPPCFIESNWRPASLPILNLVDQPGFAVGSLAERTSTIRHGGAALVALYQASTPIYTVITRRAFGVAGSAFADLDDGYGTRVAWCVLVQSYPRVLLILSTGLQQTGVAYL